MAKKYRQNIWKVIPKRNTNSLYAKIIFNFISNQENKHKVALYFLKLDGQIENKVSV